MPVDPTPNLAVLPAGHAPTAAELDTWHDVLDAESNTWTPFSPGWAASGTAVSLGNGTVVGRYNQVGKMVDFRIVLTIGSTTTFGTGSYTLSLPVAALDVNWCAACHFADASAAANRMPGVAVPSDATHVFAYFGPINTGAGTFVAGGQWQLAIPSTPSMAVGDKVIVSGRYEAA